MMEYRRVISYLYEYHGRDQGKNVGFVRLEVRNGQCRLRIYLKGGGEGQKVGRAEIFRCGREPGQIFLGTMPVRASGAEGAFLTQAQNVAGSGLPLGEFCGIGVFPEGSTRKYFSFWDERRPWDKEETDDGKNVQQEPEQRQENPKPNPGREAPGSEQTAEPDRSMGRQAEEQPDEAGRGREQSEEVQPGEMGRGWEQSEERQPGETGRGREQFEERQPGKAGVGLGQPEETPQGLAERRPGPSGGEPEDGTGRMMRPLGEEQKGQPEDMGFGPGPLGREAPDESIRRPGPSGEEPEEEAERGLGQPREMGPEGAAPESAGFVGQDRGRIEEAKEEVSRESGMPEQGMADQGESRLRSLDPTEQAEESGMPERPFSQEPSGWTRIPAGGGRLSEALGQTDGEAGENPPAAGELRRREAVQEPTQDAASTGTGPAERWNSLPEGPGARPDPAVLDPAGTGDGAKEAKTGAAPLRTAAGTGQEAAADISAQAMENQLTWTAEPRITWKQLWNTYPKYQPFGQEDPWEVLRVSVQDIGRLPREYWHLGGNDFLLNGYYAHHHLILVKDGQEELYFIGVPGDSMNQDYRVAEMFGFRQYRPAEKMGYWLFRIKL